MLIIEVHPNPEKALSDSEQQLTPESFEVLMNRIKALANALGRSA
jgi:3-deoxy-D-arabinoheptulosonate-7-phosphate synthase (EC 2.5.1.54)